MLNPTSPAGGPSPPIQPGFEPVGKSFGSVFTAPAIFVPVCLPLSMLRELTAVLQQFGEAHRLRPDGRQSPDGHIIRLVAVDAVGAGVADPDGRTIAIIGRDTLDVERLLEQGFADYITYPFSPLEIRRRLLATLIETLPRSAAPPPPAGQHMIETACRIMEKRLDVTPCLARLALDAGTNRTTLNHLFNERFGMGPITWLRRRRCEEAAKMLGESRQSILTIALSVGYTDANNFSTAFRRIYGVSPKTFRQKLHPAKNSETAAKAAGPGLR